MSIKQKDYEKDMKFKLLNIRSNDVIEIVSTFEDLDNAVNLLIEEKLKKLPKLSDEEFIATNILIRDGKSKL